MEVNKLTAVFLYCEHLDELDALKLLSYCHEKGIQIDKKGCIAI